MSMADKVLIDKTKVKPQRLHRYIMGDDSDDPLITDPSYAKVKY